MTQLYVKLEYVNALIMPYIIQHYRQSLAAIQTDCSQRIVIREHQLQTCDCHNYGYRMKTANILKSKVELILTLMFSILRDFTKS